MIEFALEKKDTTGPYWERLLKDKTKQHWLRIDFNKWKDEDESGDEGEAGGGQDLEEVSLMGSEIAFTISGHKIRGINRITVL